MKFCQKHWDQLRDKIKEQGMFHLVARDGHKLIERFKKEKEGQATIPDPLIEAHNMILQRAIECMGIGIMGTNEKDPEGHYCPCCCANEHLKPHENGQVCADYWIDSLTIYLHDEYKKEGWLNEN